MIVPLRGDEAYALRAREAFETLALRPGDELIVADNGPGDAATRAFAELATVVAATECASSYHARNAGAAAARGEWLLFVDADCVPDRGLIDAYFSDPPGDRVGAMAGAIVALGTQRSLLSRYARDRNFYDQLDGLHGASGFTAATGNLIIRSRVFDELGGFADRIRSAGDVDFCWRMHKAGWELAQRPQAAVAHRHREDLASFLAMLARYGAGARWLNGRHPGAAPTWPLVHGLVATAWDVGGHLARGRLEPAAFRALDGLGLVAHHVGYRAGNRV